MLLGSGVHGAQLIANCRVSLQFHRQSEFVEEERIAQTEPHEDLSSVKKKQRLKLDWNLVIVTVVVAGVRGQI